MDAMELCLELLANLRNELRAKHLFDEVRQLDYIITRTEKARVDQASMDPVVRAKWANPGGRGV